MRPPRRDIAAPPFPRGTTWLGGAEPRLERLLTAGPVLVHFFDFGQLNSIRALPYVTAWHERYGDHGLAVIGVQTPRFPFSRDRAAVEGALSRLGVSWPVALDSKLRIWRDYGCQGWPSLFLWGRGGALHWYHLGEGAYEATEEAIREQLTEPDGGWPPLVEPVRHGDEAGAEVIAPTSEILPGGALERPWTGGAEPLALEYAAGGAYAALDGEGELRVILDGQRRPPIAVAHPGLCELARHPRHQRHALALEADAAIRVYSLQFAPAPAG